MLREGVDNKFGFDIAFAGYELGEVVYDPICLPVALFPEVFGEMELCFSIPDRVMVCDFQVFEDAFLDFRVDIQDVLHVHYEISFLCFHNVLETEVEGVGHEDKDKYRHD